MYQVKFLKECSSWLTGQPYFALGFVVMFLMACSSVPKPDPSISAAEVAAAIDDVEAAEDDTSTLSDSADTLPDLADTTEPNALGRTGGAASGTLGTGAPVSNDDLAAELDTAGDNMGGSSSVAELPSDATDEVDVSFEAGDTADTSAPTTTDAVITGTGPVDILNIGYAEGQGVIEIQLSHPAAYTTRANEEADQFVIEIPRARLSKSLKWPYILKEFVGPFKTINAYQSRGSSTARIVVQMDDFQRPDVERSGNNLIIRPQAGTVMAQAPVEEPQDAAAQNEADKWAGGVTYDVAAAREDEKLLGARSLGEFFKGTGRYYGKPINLQVKGATLDQVVDFISQKSGVNMMLAESVRNRRVTLKLRDVPWDEALILILRANQLGYIRQGNVLRIDTLSKLKSEAEQVAKILEEHRKAVPEVVRIIPVSYATLGSLTSKVQPFLQPSVPGERPGRVSTDPQTNSLIVTGTEAQVRKVEDIVQQLDKAPQQVLIEGRIVDATEDFSRQIGINWGASQVNTLSQTGGLDGGSIVAGSGFSIAPSSAAGAGGVGSLTLNVGTINFLGNLDAALGLSENNSTARVISSQRIVTLNNQSANISQSSQAVSFSTSTTQGTGNSPTVTKTPTYKPLTVSLSVTPQITNANSVFLQVNVNRSFAGAIVDPDTQAAPTSSRTASTKVLVKNGETAVIGGMFEMSDRQGQIRLPWLSQIPILGWLFKNKSTNRSRGEMLIFLTPQVLTALGNEATSTRSSRQ